MLIENDPVNLDLSDFESERASQIAFGLLRLINHPTWQLVGIPKVAATRFIFITIIVDKYVAAASETREVISVAADCLVMVLVWDKVLRHVGQGEDEGRRVRKVFVSTLPLLSGETTKFISMLALNKMQCRQLIIYFLMKD